MIDVNRHARALAFSLATLLAALGFAPAQEVDELALRAVELHRAGKPIEALAALEEAATAAWLKAPLSFRKALFVKDQAKGYGIYEPTENIEFDKSAAINLYAEPLGYGWLTGTAGFYVIAVSFDIQLKNPQGQVVFERKEFLKSQVQGRSRNREFFTNFRLNLQGAPAGDYTVTITANDPATGKTGNFTLPFKLKG